jgi:hypothetical protein
MKQASRPLVASDSVSLPPAVPANTGWSDGEKKLADFPRCKMTLMAHSDRFCAAIDDHQREAYQACRAADVDQSQPTLRWIAKTSASSQPPDWMNPIRR